MNRATPLYVAPESSYVKSSEFGRLTIQAILIAHLPHVTTLKTCYNSVQHQNWWSCTDGVYQQLFPITPKNTFYCDGGVVVEWGGVGWGGWDGVGSGHSHIMIYTKCYPFDSLFWYVLTKRPHHVTQRPHFFTERSLKTSLRNRKTLHFV